MIFGPQVSVAVKPKPTALLAHLKAELALGSTEPVKAEFLVPDDSAYLFSMAGNRGGLKKVGISIIPSPPGWPGGYWAIFHAVQTIEEDHDPVYRLAVAGDGEWKVGSEIPEDQIGNWRISSEKYRAKLEPASSRAEIVAAVALKTGSAMAVPFRLNENYRVEGNVVVATDTSIPQPQEGQIVRAGGLLIPWTVRLKSPFKLKYSVVLPQAQEDEITPKDAFLTAWWLPSLGRLPFKVNATIEAPVDWKVRAEGFGLGERKQGREQVSRFSCSVPISYPKIVAGKYRRMASKEVRGDTFSVYQMEPIDSVRAQTDLKSMIRAATFFQDNLGRLPFHGYECYDADRYYGIESYSHTLLQRGVTHFISHEMGHSYFGGLAPCPYVNDSWNEGVTQYIDSVALDHDEDKSLERGLGTVDLTVPLDKMAVPWNLGDATYWRGCYVMKMLEAEIGPTQVMAALRMVASEQVGKDTRWADLRKYFERAGKKPLDWFWRQWVEGSQFPTLVCTTQSVLTANGSWDNAVKVEQKGVPHPFKLRFGLKVGRGKEMAIQLGDWSTTVHVETKEKSLTSEIVAFPYTLAKVRAASVGK